MHVLVLTIEWSYYVHGTNTIIIVTIYLWFYCPFTLTWHCCILAWQIFPSKSKFAQWGFTERTPLDKSPKSDEGSLLLFCIYYNNERHNLSRTHSRVIRNCMRYTLCRSYLLLLHYRILSSDTTRGLAMLSLAHYCRWVQQPRLQLLLLVHFSWRQTY